MPRKGLVKMAGTATTSRGRLFTQVALTGDAREVYGGELTEGAWQLRDGATEGRGE